MVLIYDVETANTNVGSICAVGWIQVDETEVVDQGYSLINPQTKFSKYNIAVHHLTEKDVADAPTFSQYWHECLAEKMNHSIVIAHSAGFDMAATEQALFDAGIEDLGIDYVDSLEIAREYISSTSYKLCDLAKIAGFEYNSHHAGEDAKALLFVLNYICEKYNFIDIESLIDDFIIRTNNTKINSYTPKKSIKHDKIKRNERCSDALEPVDDALAGLRICVSGDIAGLTRSDVEKQIILHGGKMTSGVSTKTDYLVIGEYPEFPVGYTSGKHQKALELISQGEKIQIIYSETFLNFINGKEKPAITKPSQIPEFVQIAHERMQKNIEQGNPVVQLSKKGEILKTYSSIDEAVFLTGIHPKCITDCIKGKQKTAGGYCWKYRESEEKQV